MSLVISIIPTLEPPHLETPHLEPLLPRHPLLYLLFRTPPCYGLPSSLTGASGHL